MVALTADRVAIMRNNFLASLSATVTCNQSLQTPALNLQDRNAARLLRIGAITSINLTVDLGSAQPVQAAILYNTNITGPGTIEVRYSSDNFAADNNLVGTITVGDEDLAEDQGGAMTQALPLFFSDYITERYWRFVINDSGNTDGFITIGHAYLGDIEQSPTALIHGGLEMGLGTLTQLTRGASGPAAGLSIGPSWREIQLQFGATTLNQQRAFLLWVGKWVGQERWFISVNPVETDFSILKLTTWYAYPKAVVPLRHMAGTSDQYYPFGLIMETL